MTFSLPNTDSLYGLSEIELEQVRRYADLLIGHGLNVQGGQLVNLASEPVHRGFLRMLQEASYARNAKFVDISLVDPLFDRGRILRSLDADLSFVPGYIPAKYHELVESGACNLRLIGSECPQALAGLPADRVNQMRMGQRLALKDFYHRGIGCSMVQWCVAAASTPAWAKEVLPDVPEEEACRELWRHILSICRADQEDCLGAWKKHNDLLISRAKRLTELKIETLHFRGPGTDLKVGLTDLAIFKGGQEPSSRGIPFEPNIPTEEVFTTPDYRRTEGHVKATRPFFVNGVLVKDLKMEFKGGVLVSFTATSGEDSFRSYIASDPGASRLGEVALVGVDSPVFRSGVVFNEILFDENAACHIAVGSAYRFCIEGGKEMTDEQAEAIGCNESSAHTDMMISDESVDVEAKTYKGETITLIQGGKWV